MVAVPVDWQGHKDSADGAADRSDSGARARIRHPMAALHAINTVYAPNNSTYYAYTLTIMAPSRVRANATPGQDFAEVVTTSGQLYKAHKHNGILALREPAGEAALKACGDSGLGYGLL
jgi:hypothetical protein